MIERDISAQIEPYLARKEFLAVVGPRQSGKTTFLGMLKSHLIKNSKIPEGNIHFVTFEDRRLLSQFEKDPVAFVESFPARDKKKKLYLLLDEFQYAEEGGQKLKLIYDTVKNIKIIITGSSSLEIKAQVGKYMVGRVLTFHLYPFSFKEYLESKSSRLENIYDKGASIIGDWLSGKRAAVKQSEDPFFEEMLRHYERYCAWGGYPAVALAKNDDERTKILGDIYNNYVLKDIKGLLELDTERNLYLLSRHIAFQSGQIVAYNNMAQAAGLDFRQLKKHIAVLAETYVCSELSPFFSNRQKELVKNPKIYFYDTGFRNYLVENMAVPEKRTDGGALVENAVFARLNQRKSEMAHLHFWRTKAGAEVDFVIRQNEASIPIEVKYTLYIQPRIPRGMMSFIDSFKPKRGILFTKNYWAIARAGSTEILFAPVYYL